MQKTRVILYHIATLTKIACILISCLCNLQAAQAIVFNDGSYVNYSSTSSLLTQQYHDDALPRQSAMVAKLSTKQLISHIYHQIATHNYEQAEVLLANALNNQPQNHDFWLLKGRLHLQQQQTSQARDIFRNILRDKPNHMWAKLELARTFFVMAEYSLARDHFEQVLATHQIPPYLANKVHTMLHAIERRKTWSVATSFDILYDDNANNRSNEDIVYINGLPFTLENEAKATAGLRTKADVDYFLPFWGQQWSVGLGLDHSEYDDKDYNDTILSFSTGPRVLFAEGKWYLHAPLQIFQRWFGGDEYQRGYRQYLRSRYRLADRLWQSLSISYGQVFFADGFKNDAEKGQNDIYSLSQQLSYYYDDNATIFLAAGYRMLDDLDRDNANELYYAQLGWEKTWHSLFTHVSLYYGYKDYENLQPLFNKIRADNTLSYTLKIGHEELNFWGMMPMVNISYHDNHSSIDFYEFDKIQTSLEFRKLF